VVGLPLDLLVQRRHPVAVPDDDRRLQELPLFPAAVHPGAMGVPLQQGERGGQRKGDDDIPPGQFQPECPGDRTESGEERNSRLENAAELLGADPEESLLVGACHEHCQPPRDGEQHDHPQRRTGCLQAGPITEADQAADQGGGERTQEIDGCDTTDIDPLPCPSCLGPLASEPCRRREMT